MDRHSPIMVLSNNRSEREILQEQLRNIRNQKKFICSWEAETLRRLAEIERETVERERSLLVDSQTEYVT